MPGTVYEVSLMSDVAGWINAILTGRHDLPFCHAKIEESAKGKRTRRDLTLYDKDGKIALTGEAKMPDAPYGGSPYAETVVQDAFKKASDVGARYFFTWNVNRFILWDPGKVTLPILQRHSWDRELFCLRGSAEVESPAVVNKLRNEFLPQLLEYVAGLYRGDVVLGVLPPDRRFIQMLENFLERPALLTEFAVFNRYGSSSAFKKDFTHWMHNQGWTIPDNESELSETLQRAAKLCCYVLSNKLIFYESLRRHFPTLKPLKVPKTVENVDQMHGLLSKYFEQAQKATADYETLFWPDYGAKVPLLAEGAIEAWREVIDQISLFNLSAIDYDVLGPIFERLIDPEAKHRWGQHYTRPNIVDVINAFTIRKPDAVVMDPACGSGTFLVRAYARKRWLDPTLQHPILLSQLYGADISGYAVHLSALGLASRELVEANNYPRVDRKDFFDIAPESKFMRIPHLSGTLTTSGLGSRQTQVVISRIDAGVGNPPYIRQEEILKARKKHYQTVAKKDAHGFEFSGRSDIYIYFWPHLANFLNSDGYLGLLTSSSWLDVEYGFRLQRWFLENFKILAILESACEPWFEGARIATTVTIVQPCAEETERMKNYVRFVQLRVSLADLLESDGTEDGRQRASDHLRDCILSTKEDTRTAQLRILVRRQRQLWEEGCRLQTVAGSEDEGTEDQVLEQRVAESSSIAGWEHAGVYRGGKWGRYLRAPDFFFEILAAYGEAFVPLGELAEIRFGVKSGCDDFFFPKDITPEALGHESNARKFEERYGVARSGAEAGKVKIVEAGDGTVWPIEAEYLETEVHSPMEIDSVIAKPQKLKRVILLVDEPKEKLKGTLVLNYLEYGEKERFGGDYPPPKRSTCATRSMWYDLTGNPRGDALWPMTQKYRHIVAANPEKLICNHRLFSVRSRDATLSLPLVGVLNSTIVAFFKHFYGRYAGMEHTLDTEIVDVNMLLVPDIRKAGSSVHDRIGEALKDIGRREVGYMLEDAFLEMVPLSQLCSLESAAPVLPQELRLLDRQQLDRAVLGMIGVSRGEVPDLLDRLYKETALVYRRGRVLDIRTAANKKRSKKTESTGAADIAENVWGNLPAGTIRIYPQAFLKHDDPTDDYSLPEGKAKFIEDMFHPPRLKFKTDEIEFRHREQAKLALTLHESGLRESLTLPSNRERCREVLQQWADYFEQLKRTFQDEAGQRTPDEEKVDGAVKMLLRRASGR